MELLKSSILIGLPCNGACFGFTCRTVSRQYVAFHGSMATHRDPVTKRPSVMKFEGFPKADMRPELDFGDTDSHG